MTPSITESAITTALRSFLLAILPAGTEVFLGQENLVPEPKGDNYVIMTPIGRDRLGRPVSTWTHDPNSPPTVITVTGPTSVGVQLDVHGALSSDNVQVIAMLFFSPYASQAFATFNAAVAPLYTTDPIQAPFINGENQFEDRWTLTAMMQVNPAVSTPAQFADSLQVGIINVDAEYPPGGP